MPGKTEIAIDAASALCLGARSRQEDALATSFSLGSELGFAVLSDGMGGHAAGDVASRIIVAEIFAELTLGVDDPGLAEAELPELLRSAANVANRRIRARIDAAPETAGMGGTVIVVVVIEDRLYWLSVGDSPLYLFRDGQLTRLNDDHSLAPQIDLMVREGLIDPEVGRNHPQRNCLTSALIGGEIPSIDCPDQPFTLRSGDLVLVASDGLQYLPDDRIAAVLGRTGGEPSATIAGALMAGVTGLADPEQDNISVIVLKATDTAAERRLAPIAWLSPATILRAWTGAIAPARHLGTRS
ncbi:PP2C family protein-serine/threonine phosphatase [Defluviimonas sp. SAOS-178_SWC]|uniref:PP2C family protein-serine/threonine phosphatase n=1 Tax=Defluviimonas sp. SAOS-178_SWC TaxID=3121287 RepID=UPI0032215E65